MNRQNRMNVSELYDIRELNQISKNYILLTFTYLLETVPRSFPCLTNDCTDLSVDAKEVQKK